MDTVPWPGSWESWLAVPSTLSDTQGPVEAQGPRDGAVTWWPGTAGLLWPAVMGGRKTLGLWYARVTVGVYAAVSPFQWNVGRLPSSML